MIFVIANPGLRTVFIRRIAQEPDNAAVALGEQLGLRIILATAAGSIAVAICAALRYPAVVVGCAAVSAVALGISTVASAFGDVLQGMERFQSTAAINGIAGVALTAASVIAAMKGAGALGMSFAYLVGPVASMLMLLRAVQSKLFRVRIVWSYTRYLVLIQEVRMLGAQQFLTAAQDRIELILIPKLMGLKMFGFFAAGTMPASRLVAFPDGLATSFYPRIANSIQTDRRAAANQVAQLMMVSLAVCLPIAVLMQFMAAPIARVLFPRHPFMCREIIQITMWSLPIHAIVFPLTYALQAASQHSETAKVTMWSTVCGFITTVVLTSRFGIVGACWSWIARPVLLFIFMAPAFIRVFPGVMPRLPIRRICVSALGMAACMWFIASLRLPVKMAIALGCSLGLIFYGCGLILTRVVEASQIKQLIRR